MQNTVGEAQRQWVYDDLITSTTYTCFKSELREGKLPNHNAMSAVVVTCAAFRREVLKNIILEGDVVLLSSDSPSASNNVCSSFFQGRYAVRRPPRSDLLLQCLACVGLRSLFPLRPHAQGITCYGIWAVEEGDKIAETSVISTSGAGS